MAGVLLTALGLSVVGACFINDRTIEESRGSSVAEVVDTSFFRTVVRFSTDEGKVYIPQNGVLYPAGLKEGQSVRVEYDSRNPELVRVAGRTMVLSLLPVFSSLAIVWAVVLTGVWMLRGRPRRTEDSNRAGEPARSP
ncbi:DUF3592 domain-containing protein [Parasphingorhabdus pacifica]